MDKKIKFVFSEKYFFVMGKSKFLAENTVMRYLFTGLLLFFPVCSHKGLRKDSVEQVLTNYFQELGKTPQEKLYLHLDKSYYGAGETDLVQGVFVKAHYPSRQQPE